jgi:AcrR family transcriptional regulator
MSKAKKSVFTDPDTALRSEDLPHLHGLGRRERRAAETRLRLFRCALRLYAERGLPNVTVKDITEAADVGKGTFFNYFPSKDHVLGVLAEIQLGKVHEALDHAKSGKSSIQSVFRRLVTAVTEEPGRSPELARALMSSFLASRVVRERMQANMAEGRRMIEQIVVIGQKRREIDPKLKGEQVALLLQQTFMGTVLMWSLHEGRKLQSVVELSFRFFWRAIAVGKEE